MLHVSKNQHQGVWNKESLISKGVESLKNSIRRQNEISSLLKNLFEIPFNLDNLDVNYAKTIYLKTKKIATENIKLAEDINHSA